MAAGKLRAVVATASLDLGIDWGAVDQVIQVGAPKGVARLLQRVGRANHRMDEPSRAVLVPANRFEVIECTAALEAVRHEELDGDPPRPGGLDVLAQHILAMACAGALPPGRPLRRGHPRRALCRRSRGATSTTRCASSRMAATRCGSMSASASCSATAEGLVHVRDQRVARQLRMNLGTIVETPMLKVRLRGGPVLGEVEEWFVSTLVPGDTFIFAGQALRFEALDAMGAIVTRGGEGEPRVPAYAGARMPLSHLAGGAGAGDPARPEEMAPAARAGAGLAAAAAQRSALPEKDGLLVETFRAAARQWFMVAYCFEGRLAHQTLGMLVTKRMERAGLRPARLPRHRLRPRHLVGLRADRCRPAVRGGHPRRGPGGLDGGKLHAPPHLPQHRDHRRADREEPPGPGESPAAR